MSSLLLIIDFINEIVNPKSKAGVCANYVKRYNVIKKTNQAIQYACDKNIPIVFVKVGFSDDYKECPRNSPMFGKLPELGLLKLSSWGCEFHPDLAVTENDQVIVKHRVSAYYNTKLPDILKEKNIDTVVISGVSTNMTVELTSKELHDRDYNVIVLEDACGAADETIHQASIQTLQRLTKVMLVEEWMH